MNNFLKNNSSKILTCVGGVGVIVTSIFSSKATIKAYKILSEKEQYEDLTLREKIKEVWPVYIPTILFGTSTILCIFGSNILSQKNQASLVSAYALINQSYKEYKDKVKELYGDDSDLIIKKEIAKNNYDETLFNGEKQLFYDSFSMRYFESTFENVLRAEYYINKKFASEFFVTINDFYSLLGIDKLNIGNDLKWRSDDVMALNGLLWIDFENELVVMDDGLECYMINIKNDPCLDLY